MDRRRQWVPKETSEYKTLLDLVLGEDIYLVNYYGLVSKLNCTFADHVQHRLRNVGQNAIVLLLGSM